MLHALIQNGREAQRTGAWDDALAHYEAAVAEADLDGKMQEKADVLRWMGEVYRERGDLDSAQKKTETSRDIAQQAGQHDRVALAVNGLGIVHLIRGELSLASDCFLRSREIAEQVGNERLLGHIDLHLGIIANIQGNIVAALLSYRSSLQRYRKLGDEARMARALNNMGKAHVDLGEWEAAERAFRDASERAERSGEVRMIGLVELNKVELHIRRRRYEEALLALENSLEVFHRLRLQSDIGEAYKYYGVIFRQIGKPKQSDTHFGLALNIAQACGDRLLQAEVQMEWALLHMEEERQQEGILHMNRALKIYRDLQAGREVLDIERRLNGLRDMYLPAVQAWGANRAERGDPYQTGHSQRVAQYATKLAQEAGVEGWDLTWVQIGALIHDLGNLAVPGDLVERADEPENQDQTVIRLHSSVGESLAKQLEFPEEVQPIVRHHHEEWGGTGQPDQLTGEKIPFGARVVGIVDAFDALTSPRSFRPAYTRDEALEIMSRGADQKFDPNLWGTFRDMLRRGEFDR